MRENQRVQNVLTCGERYGERVSFMYSLSQKTGFRLQLNFLVVNKFNKNTWIRILMAHPNPILNQNILADPVQIQNLLSKSQFAIATKCLSTLLAWADCCTERVR
jgi:hypothetical protein